MKKVRIFEAQDKWVAALATLISFAVYFYTAAPNVTLLDSGEFLVAALHFGVPHPPGYPLWTLVNWIFQLLPLGNSSWEIAICSGVCASVAVGICALLASNLLKMEAFPYREGLFRLVRPCVALTFALLLAFSVSLWSQAVIVEVYGLHALMVSIYFLLLYCWVHEPQRDRYMLGAFFALALSFSNHHLSIVLSPIPFLLIVLVRRRAFWDWVVAAFATGLLAYVGFAILSGDPFLIKTSLRFFYCFVLGLIVFVFLRKGRIRLRPLAFLPFVVCFGLLPYLYMPFASSTNPPMNWSHTRDAAGFYYSLNRSQYSGTLAEDSLRTLGKVMGTYPAQLDTAPDNNKSDAPSFGTNFQMWSGFFWSQLILSFTPLAAIAYFASIIAVLRMPLGKRAWIYMLHVSFVLAAFLQPLMEHVQIDQGSWWLQMPYHGYTNLIFALICSIGTGFLLYSLATRKSVLIWLSPLLLILPVTTFKGNYAECSQRDHWFGWMFGHDMLKDLPPNSIMIGGSDPGRFIPTYMIFGESPQKPSLKRDPSFDRRDLYIITQNALGEEHYMDYLRDQYSTQRPLPKTAFEHWLGRDTVYPGERLAFPTKEQNDALVQQGETAANKSSTDPYNYGAAIAGSVLKWLWEKNRDRHDFFVEEMFPIKWTYDYAIPHGLIYQINKTKLDQIPPAAVAADFAFWKDYKAKLLNNPEFAKDYDAQRSFSKLRQTIGNIYSYRKMDAEAERAYQEALELWPGNVECILALAPYFWKRGDYQGAVQLFDNALREDGNNVDLWRLRILADQRERAEADVLALEKKLRAEPKNGDMLVTLVKSYINLGEIDKSDALVQRAAQDFPNDPDMLHFIIDYYVQKGDPAKSADAAHSLTVLQGSNAENYLLLARAYFAENKKKEFYETAAHALELGGLSARDELINDPFFDPWRHDPEFDQLVGPGGLPIPGQVVKPSTGGHEQKILRSP